VELTHRVRTGRSNTRKYRIDFQDENSIRWQLPPKHTKPLTLNPSP
jgi:hypothetical protein